MYANQARARPSGNIRSPSNMTGASTIAGSMRATDFSSDEKDLQDDGSTRSQRYSQGESDRHKDIIQNSGSSISSWEENFDKETRNATARSEKWFKNAKSVLNFTGLFAVVVVGFLALSLPLLQPSPGVYDTHFRPPHYAVLANALWLISLIFTLACALLATLVQQWALAFSEAADKKDSDLKLSQRVRIYAFFLAGVERFVLPATVDTIGVLLHASLHLFSAGLVYFLLNINHTLGYMTLGIVASGFLLNLFLAIMPLFIPNSPYQTPLSPFLWYGLEVTIYFGLYPFRWIYSVPNSILEHRNKIWKGMRSALESKAIQSTTREKPHDDDDDLEEFLKWLHRVFYLSAWFKRQYSVRLREGFENLVTPVINQLLFATLDLEDAERQSQRLKVCLNSIWCFSGTVDRHFQAIRKHLDDKTNDPWGPLSAETWSKALDMMTHSEPLIALRAQYIQALMAVMWKDKKWQCPSPEEYLRRQLDVSDDMINGWVENGDQLKIAVAANLLSKSLPLLRQLEIGEHQMRRIEFKGILNQICGNLVTSNLPPSLRARFVDSAKVMRVFASLYPDDSEPWREIINIGPPV